MAQEVELDAEAEAVVVLGPRSVLLPSMGKEEMMMLLLGRERGSRGEVCFVCSLVEKHKNSNLKVQTLENVVRKVIYNVPSFLFQLLL